MFGKDAFDLLVKKYDFQTVVDIGSGAGHQARAFADQGKTVTAVDLGKSVYFKKGTEDPRVTFLSGDFDALSSKLGRFDCVWACHVLEHQRNPGLFLEKLGGLLEDKGVLAITVPPLKHQIVGGHVTLWNAGLLLYQLVLAGFDCKKARIKKYGYNISLIVEKWPVDPTVYDRLSYDSGDLTILKPYLPDGLGEGFDGNIERLNWEDI